MTVRVSGHLHVCNFYLCPFRLSSMPFSFIFFCSFYCSVRSVRYRSNNDFSINFIDFNFVLPIIKWFLFFCFCCFVRAFVFRRCEIKWINISKNHIKIKFTHTKKMQSGGCRAQSYHHQSKFKFNGFRSFVLFVPSSFLLSFFVFSFFSNREYALSN